MDKLSNYRLNVPLNALRAFEAAARHLSIKDAALELGVTPSAVSHQLRGWRMRWVSPSCVVLVPRWN